MISYSSFVNFPFRHIPYSKLATYQLWSQMHANYFTYYQITSQDGRFNSWSFCLQAVLLPKKVSK